MGTAETVGGAPRLRVVVVDDEALIGRVAQRVLAEHDVACFVDPTEALAHLVAGPPPDLVLCDVSMPVLGGVELYEQAIAAVPVLAERFVFLSGGASTARLRTALASTGAAQMEKPFTAAELRGLVERRAVFARRRD